MQETERAIRTALQAAQKMANIRVDHVIACFSGADPRLRAGRRGSTGRSGVTEQDVAGCLACDVPDYGEGREVLHAQPVNFALDHRSGCAIRAARWAALSADHAYADGRCRCCAESGALRQAL